LLPRRLSKIGLFTNSGSWGNISLIVRRQTGTGERENDQIVQRLAARGGDRFSYPSEEKSIKSKTVQDKRAKVPQRAMNLACAEKVVRAAQKKARELGITMSVAVVDESGNLVYFVRGDTSSFITFETARGKAVAAAGFRRPTQDYEPHFKEHPAFWSSIAENLKLVPGPGGYPLTRNGVMIGGVGCGGGLGGQDELCAKAGARAVNS